MDSGAHAARQLKALAGEADRRALGQRLHHQGLGAGSARSPTRQWLVSGRRVRAPRRDQRRDGRRGRWRACRTDRVRRRAASRSARSLARPADSPLVSASGTITPPSFRARTFTVSNLGMYGMTAITPVINPAAGCDPRNRGMRERPGVSRDGEIVEHDADDPDALLRPSNPVRRRCGSVPGPHSRTPRGSVEDGALADGPRECVVVGSVPGRIARRLSCR